MLGGSYRQWMAVAVWALGLCCIGCHGSRPVPIGKIPVDMDIPVGRGLVCHGLYVVADREGRVWALTVGSGRCAWVAETKHLHADMPATGGVAVRTGDGGLVVVFGSGEIQRVQPDTGHVLWTWPRNSEALLVGGIRIVSVGRSLYLSDGSRVGRIDSINGVLDWEESNAVLFLNDNGAVKYRISAENVCEVPEAISEQGVCDSALSDTCDMPVLAFSGKAIIHPCAKRGFVAITPGSNKLLWGVRTEARQEEIEDPRFFLASSEHLVYVETEIVEVYDASGRLCWSKDRKAIPPNPLHSRILLGGGGLIIGDTDGVACYDLSTGRELWRVGGGTYGGLAIQDGYLYYPSRGTLWRYRIPE
jgi:outer membrane protein assembly factor BamB